MPIVFEGVGYSYQPPSKKKPAKRKNGLFARRSKAAQTQEEPQAPACTWALQDISFTLEDGEFLGVAGHTGSGKSTLIQHMNALLSPTVGRVLVNGANMADKQAAAKARGTVGIVFQYPEHQLFAPTVFEDVAFGPRNLGLAPDEVEERVREAVAQVGLSFADIRDKSPFELSGGQQRRGAFAGVLAMKPKVLILDEPVAGLDPAARADFLALISRLHAGGLTVVMVSHTMEDLAERCSRIIVLKSGRIFADGTPAEVFSRAEELRAIGLGVPAAQALATSLATRGIALENRLYDMEGLADELAAAYKREVDEAGAGGSSSEGEGNAEKLAAVYTQEVDEAGAGSTSGEGNAEKLASTYEQDADGVRPGCTSGEGGSLS